MLHNVAIDYIPITANRQRYVPSHRLFPMKENQLCLLERYRSNLYKTSKTRALWLWGDYFSKQHKCNGSAQKSGRHHSVNYTTRPLVRELQLLIVFPISSVLKFGVFRAHSWTAAILKVFFLLALIFVGANIANAEDVNLGTMSPSVGFRIKGAAFNYYTGRAVRNAGDINNDGIQDIILGSDAVGTSIVYVVFGRDVSGSASSFDDIQLLGAAMNSAVGFRILGAAMGDGCGNSVSGAGDINGDGIDDIILGAPYADPPSGTNAGISYVVFGKLALFGDVQLPSGVMVADVGFRIIGAALDDHSGWSVSAAGDINNDGVGDVIIGARYADPTTGGDAGISYVIFGRKLATAGVTPFGDVELTTGAASMLSTIGFRILGAAAAFTCGHSVSSVGDVNNDNIDDVIVAAKSVAYVIFGRSAATQGSLPFTDIVLPTIAMSTALGFRIIGAETLECSGRNVGAAGDVNGDGIGDLILGSPDADPPSGVNAGISYVVFGKSTGLGDVNLASMSAAVGFRIIGAVAADRSGNSVSAAGDVNNDGVADIIVGAYAASPSVGVDAGISYVIYGRNTAAGATPFVDIQLPVPSNPMSPSVGFKISGIASGDYSGYSVSAAGDLNSDGIDDIVVGANNVDTELGTNAGTAYVIFGVDFRPTSQPSSQPSRQPSGQPSRQPSSQPTRQPSGQPSRQPSLQPSSQPSTQPSGQPSRQPSSQPSQQPSRQPSGQPTAIPTSQPTSQPSQQPSRQPSRKPSGQPSSQPSMQPSSQPVSQPSTSPTGQPSCQPSLRPSRQPTGQPTSQPSTQPTTQPSLQPSRQPSVQPTAAPTQQPSAQPSATPSGQPTSQPSLLPSAQPTMQPSLSPTLQPSCQPTSQPSCQPSTQPTKQPSALPSMQSSSQPSAQPSIQPTSGPTSQPSNTPSTQPSAQPSGIPSLQPSVQPAARPSQQPSTQPSAQPSLPPTSMPSQQPTAIPSSQPSGQPSLAPTQSPSTQPSAVPSGQPTSFPSQKPTTQPTAQPSNRPSGQPSGQPSHQPIASPTSQPTMQPTSRPTDDPHVGEWVTSTSIGNEINEVFSVNSTVWVCVHVSSAATSSCAVLGAVTGLTETIYSFPWEETTAITQTQYLGQLVISGRSTSGQNSMASHIAVCTRELTAQLSCTVKAFHDTSFVAATYVPIANKMIHIGAYNAFVLMAVSDTAYGTDEPARVANYVYSFETMGSVSIIHVLSPPVYVGGFFVGTATSANGLNNYILAGVVRTDSGSMTAMYLAPASGSVLNSAELVNAMALEYEHPDSFIAGGLQLSDSAGMHAYLMRVNAFFGSVKYSVRYIGSSSGVTGGGRWALSTPADYPSIARGMVLVDHAIYMILDQSKANNISCTSLTVLKIDTATGLILQQVHVSSPSACLSCMGITTTSDSLFLYLACTVRYNTTHSEAVVIATDLRLEFPKLPMGFTLSTNTVFREEYIPFRRYALPVTSKRTVITTSDYTFSTAEGAPTLHPSVGPTRSPSVKPSSAPSGQPSSSPSAAPSVSPQPTSHPSTGGPTNTYKPTVKPTQQPSRVPTSGPTLAPSVTPTVIPTAQPSTRPNPVSTTLPSVIKSVAPTLMPTAKPTRKPSVLPSAKPTPAPTTGASTVAVATASIGRNGRKSDDAVMIFVYVVAGVTGIWCFYQVLKCAVRAQHDSKRKKMLRAELEIIQLSTANRQHSHKVRQTEDNLVVGAYIDSNVVTGVNSDTDPPRQCGAYATGVPILSHKTNSGDSSSVLVSSLHSSEMSDISYSVYSDEVHSEQSNYLSEHTRSRETIMEEGGEATHTNSFVSDGSSVEVSQDASDSANHSASGK